MAAAKTESKKSIFELIPKIAAEVKPVAKDMNVPTGKGRGYKARGVEAIYKAVSHVMSKHGVFSTCRVLSVDRKEVVNKYETKGIHAVIHYEFTFHGPDGVGVPMEAIGEAIEWGGDKGANKCFSVAHKIALIGIFCIPTEGEMDDPEKDAHHEAQAEETRSKLFGDKPSPRAQLLADLTAVMKEKKVAKEMVQVVAIEKFKVGEAKDLTDDQLKDLIETLKKRDR